MTAAQRRDSLMQRLNAAADPISATTLAKQFSVSRQIIVGDIALLRAAGADITATPRGYVLCREGEGLLRTVACRHSAAEMETELNLMVDQGAQVLDVVVEHPVYGELVGQLQLRSRYDVQQFVQKSAASEAMPLSGLTGGVHLHHLRCPSEEVYQRVCQQLKRAGFFVQDT